MCKGVTNQTGTVTFTGTQSSTNGFNSIVVNIHSTVNSAAGSNPHVYAIINWVEYY